MAQEKKTVMDVGSHVMRNVTQIYNTYCIEEVDKQIKKKYVETQNGWIKK